MGQSYRDLIAWQKAMDFVMDVYRTSKTFPRDEVYGLASQLRRAAVGVPSNIAEGQARFSANEFHFFWRVPEDRWLKLKPSSWLLRTSPTSHPNMASIFSTRRRNWEKS